MIFTKFYRLFFTSILPLQRVLADTDAPCYRPNGVRAFGFFPCNPTAYMTSCCPAGWTCYSNSMCVVTHPSTANSSHPVGTSMRGSCTNPAWNNAACGDFCLMDGVMGGSLKPCGDNKFCCADDSSCSCSNGAFIINPGRVQTIIGIQGLEHTQTSTISVSAATATTLKASTLATVTATSTNPNESTATKPTATAATQKSTNKRGRNAGIAIGVILGVVAIAVAAWLIRKNYLTRQRNRPPPPITFTSEPVGPPPTQDPYRIGNAANLSFIPTSPISRTMSPRSHIENGDAPYDNEYEMDASNRAPFLSMSDLGSRHDPI